MALAPQPSSNPQDPLNWSSFKKHMILICVSIGAFVGDFGLTAGIPAVVLQSQEWGLSAADANYPNSVAVMMIGAGSLVWMPLTNCWGRAPVFFWTTLMGLMFTLACLLTRDWETFYAMRALQALTQATGSTIGLAIIHDMFFFHEHARKIGIWYVFFLTSPFAGPMFGNFMVAGLGTWRPLFWLVFAINAALLGMILVFFDETRYNRSVEENDQPQRANAVLARLARVLGIWQLKHHSGYFDGVIDSYWRLVVTCFKPIIPLTVFIYGTIFMWNIGINQSSAILLEIPQALGGYGLSARAIGYIYFAPIVATIIGEVFGHFYNDYLVRRHMKRHNNVFAPGVRLWATYPMAVIMIPGLVLVGQTLDKHLHWVGIVFGWGMYQGGVMVVSVAVVAFIFDCYPERPSEVSALINFGRAPFGFVVGYFQADWGAKQGFDVSFGLQAVVTVVCFATIAIVQRWGRSLM
jgi:MFS family permease